MLYFQSVDVVSPLLPLIQVSGLLQSRKSIDDVQNIFDLCSSLTKPQVLKVSLEYFSAISSFLM